MSLTLNKRPTLGRSYDRSHWTLTHYAHHAEKSYELRIANDGAGDEAFTFGYNEMGDWHHLVLQSEFDARVEDVAFNAWDIVGGLVCPNCTMLSVDACAEAEFNYGDCQDCRDLRMTGARDFVNNDHLYHVMTPTERDIMLELRRYWDALTLMVGVAL